MTKTLTEQWYDGELPLGNYYIRVKGQGEEKIIEYQIAGSAFFYDTNVVIEILAPVPSYEEYEDVLQQNVNQESAIETYIEEIKRLQGQLDSAIDALYEYIKMYGVERECSKFLQKYAEEVK